MFGNKTFMRSSKMRLVGIAVIIVNKTEATLDLSKYPEPEIDRLREQKDLQLAKFRAKNEKSLKEKDAAFGSLKDKQLGKSYSRAR
jgi:hypothetical protein